LIHLFNDLREPSMTLPSEKKKLLNPVLMAAQKKEPTIMMAVLSHRIAPKININERDGDDCSAMGYIIQYSTGDDATAAVEALIAAGAKVDTLEPDFDARSGWNRDRNSYDYPKLHLAQLSLAQYNSPWKPIFDALGPKKLKTISSEAPLLHVALLRGLRGATEMLIGAGADVTREDPKMGLPISCCASAADFAMLVAAGAKLNAPDSNGKTALQIISSSCTNSDILSMATAAAEAEAHGRLATFKEGQQTKIKASDEIAQPLIEALFNSISQKNTPRIESLWKTLNLGRDKARLIDARDKKGQNLLHASLSARNFGLSRRLLKHGLSPNVFDNKCSTPLSIILGLSHERTERDRSGEKRSKFCAELLTKVDWSARSERGLGHYESLLCVSIERRNAIAPDLVFSKADATRPHWLEMSTDGETCTLSRTIARMVSERRAPSNSVMEQQEARLPLHSVFQEQIRLPEFGLAQATAILKAAASQPQNNNLQYLQSPTTKLLDVIESQLDTFKNTGIDPDSIAWATALASSRPTLFAAIESWRIAGASRSISTPRARAKSL
jgi:hypothetical protein